MSQSCSPYPYVNNLCYSKCRSSDGNSNDAIESTSQTTATGEMGLEAVINVTLLKILWYRKCRSGDSNRANVVVHAGLTAATGKML